MSYITVDADKVKIAAQTVIDRIMCRRAEKDEHRISWRSYYAWGDLDKAETLLIMAENGDPVNIDNEDSKLLWG